jgi:hypothetical protein
MRAPSSVRAAAFNGVPPEHQADAHARREQHGEPRHVREFRLRVLAADADLADRQHDQHQAEDHEDVAADHEQPVEIRDRPALGAVERDLGIARHDQRADHEDQHEQTGDPEYGMVYVDPVSLQVVLSDLIIRLVTIGHVPLPLR